MKKIIIWKYWATIYPPQASFDEKEVGKRLLLAMVIDSYKCLESGLIQEPKDADVGSILGLGFPIHTGGVMSYINFVRAPEFALYSEKLALKYGERFALLESLKERIKTAGTNRVFYKN